MVRVDYCKERNIIPARGRWSLQNEVAIILPEVIFALPAGCNVKVIGIELSPHVIAGRYKLQVESVYKPWPWVEETIVRQTAPFTILSAYNESTPRSN